MNDIQKALFLQCIREEVSKDPSLCRNVIDAATEGVKDFADKQRDIGTQAAFKLLCVIESVDVPRDGKFGVFTFKETLDVLEGCFGRTPVLAKLREKFGVKEQS